MRRRLIPQCILATSKALNEQRAKINEQRTKTNEQRGKLTSNGQKLASNEQQAKVPPRRKANSYLSTVFKILYFAVKKSDNGLGAAVKFGILL